MPELTSGVKIEPKNNSMNCEHTCAELKQHPMPVNHQELTTIVD